ncbi:hypothetical protein, partial [Bacillus tropicus]|uniref:hypothetical protein n=1 Tax=Bacillus tropicus TaxID=2026188 RepID=UPI001C99CAC9
KPKPNQPVNRRAFLPKPVYKKQKKHLKQMPFFNRYCDDEKSRQPPYFPTRPLYAPEYAFQPPIPTAGLSHNVNQFL